MGELNSIIILKLILFTLGSLGIVFHLLALTNPQEGKKMEQALGAEIGSKKRFVSWLETDRMELQERLIKSKAYNIFAVIFLLVLFILLFQI